ncbi:hypothetical protein VFPBJ_03554 [Purpureocillium lilacinum]|uniref:Uncharacterized protein n=1 Tax=Purpureocillium lilacinum TaxID=33203 RepID=A0A179H3J1_PURLI|nr:hypothetical protein VFPBJ_03554 [Purpureocillium lilacinum]
MCVLVAPHSSSEARVPSSQGHSDTDRAVACWSSVSARARRVVIGPLPSKRLAPRPMGAWQRPLHRPVRRRAGAHFISQGRAGHHPSPLPPPPPLSWPGSICFAFLALPVVCCRFLLHQHHRQAVAVAWFANLEDASLHPLVIHSFVAPPHAALYDYTRAPPIRLTPLPRIVRLHSFSRHPSSPSPSHRLGRRHNPLSRRLAACHCYACVTIPSQLLIVLRAV